MSTPELKPLVKLEDVNFPGHELFTEEARVLLATMVRDVVEFHPEAVKISMQESGTSGWKENGFPNTTAISRLEEEIKDRGCVLLIRVTSKVLGKEISTQEVMKLLEDSAGIYETIPLLVHKHFNQ